MSKKENAGADAKIEIDKAQFEELMKSYEDMKNQIALLTKDAANSKAKVSESERDKLYSEAVSELIEQGNAGNDELVEIYVDRGNAKGSKQVEVSVNGVQYIVKKGVRAMVPRCVADVIKNAENQTAIAQGLMEERQAEYEKALAAGAL